MDRPPNGIPAQAGDAYHGFLSYCSVDTEIVRTLVHDLQRKGLRIWWDQDTGEHDLTWRMPDDERGHPLGSNEQEILEKLHKFLSTSTILIMVGTRAAQASSWVQVEFAYAFEHGNPIIIWHADGDFQEGRAEQVPLRAITREQAVALIGEHPFDNVISHISNDRRSVHGVADMIDYYICFAEYLEWKGERVCNTAIDRHEREFDRIWHSIPALLAEIEAKHERRLRMSRTPGGRALPNRRLTGAQPWIVRTQAHLERVLADEDYRRSVFEALNRGESHHVAGYRKSFLRIPPVPPDAEPQPPPNRFQRLLRRFRRKP